MCCEYCFESHSDNRKFMNESHIKALIDRIKTRILDEDFKKVNISFTGGEPLMNFKFIKAFMKVFKQRIVNVLGIEYSISLITNGTLIDDEVAEFLRTHNCSGVQITIDGDRKTHNLSRNNER